MSKKEFCCSEMQRAAQDSDIPVIYIPKFREFGICILDGGSSYLELKYCPWCGQEFPESLRVTWFDRLEKLGIDPLGQEVPAEFSDERWYKNLDME